MHKVFAFIFLVFILSSCERESRRQTTITGKVIEMETQTPLPGSTVFFFKQDQNNPSIYLRFHQMTTDANGKFTYTFSSEEGYNYFIYATYSNYLLNGFVVIAPKQENQVNILLTQPGFMNIHIQNTSPFDSSDKLEIYDSDYWNPVHTFQGTSIDTTITIQHFGSRTNSINWRVTKNDTTISYNQSFNFIPQDTLAFNLNY